MYLVAVLVIFSLRVADLPLENSDSKFRVYYLVGGDSENLVKKTIKIRQKNKIFDPHISVGTTKDLYYFPNEDDFAHNVYSQLGPLGVFDLGVAEKTIANMPKKERQFKFIDKIGTTIIGCAIHPSMSAVIFTVPSKYYYLIDKEEYKFDAPNGTYTLMMLDYNGNVKKIKEYVINR